MFIALSFVSKDKAFMQRSSKAYYILSLLFEPSGGKTNNVVSEQVRHKPACTSTEKS